jgi:Histidine kinase-, DNA gyrase B-, and HSP90-like ATPase
VSLNGYDPLDSLNTSDRLLAEATHRNILNILKSYTGFYDIFSEAIQNAVDGLEVKWRLAVDAGRAYEPKLVIDIDLPGRSIRVIDNGVGMTESEFKLCFTPNVSFKRNLPLRGQKGVGATFLAYGFSFVHLASKRDGVELAAILRGGRLWVEDATGKVPRPRFEDADFDTPPLTHEESGTAIRIVLGNAPGERPQKLDWQGATTARQWLDVLRVKTPLGGIYLMGSKFQYSVTVRVKAPVGESEEVSRRVEYFYPHEIPNVKQASLADLKEKLSAIKGDPSTVQRKLPDQFKNLECLWDIWDHSALLKDQQFESLTADERALIERHSVMVYGAFMNSTSVWDYLNDEILKLRGGTRLLRGGLQMASDHMPQGELITIPLKKAIGYQNNTHVIVHFTNGNPDLGRKTFQPEYHDLGELLATQVVKTLTQYRNLVRADTGAKLGPQDKHLYDWKKEQEKWRDSHALQSALPSTVTILSEPQEEQDVIALFHELVGAGVIRGLRFFSTTYNAKYDGLFDQRHEDATSVFHRERVPLGISKNLDLPYVTAPSVLEYKFDFDAIVRDFNRDIKFIKHIDLVVCWTAGNTHQELISLQPYFVGNSGAARQVYGATHAAYRVGGGDEPLFEVIVLKDLLAYLLDPAAEEARQRSRYSVL